MSIKDQLLNLVLNYRNAGHNHIGLCSVTYKTKHPNEMLLELKSAFKSWKYFSGCSQFPVEGSEKKYFKQKNMISKTTKYGRLRRSLLKHVIKELSK